MKAGIRSKLLAVLGIATLALGACDNGSVDSPPSTVAAPVFSPDGGSHQLSVVVSLSTTTAGASIRYTTDGSNPSATAGDLYTDPFTLTTTTTVRAIAYASGMTSSGVISKTFTITAPDQVVAPVFSPAEGSYIASVAVSLSTSTDGASIRYTIDGSTPTATTGTVYAAPFTLATNGTTTVKAIAYADGMTDSDVVSADYTVIGTVAVNDFEADAIGATYPIINSSGALNASVIAIGDVLVAAATPGATTGNASAQVLAVGSGAYNQYAKLPLTLPSGTSLSDYGYLYVKAVFPNNGGDNGYKNIYAFIDGTISDGFHATTDAIGSSTSTGGTGTTWKEFFIPLDATKAAAVSGTSLELALGISRSGTAAGPYYLDEIKLYPKTVALRTFEADAIGATYPIINSSGALNASVIAIGNVLVAAATPGATTGNASAQVLEVGSGAYNQYVKFPLTLPAGTSLSDYAYVTVRAVFPNNGGDNGYKNILAFVDGTISDGFHASTEAVGQSISTGGQSTTWGVFMIPIDPTKAAAVSGTSLEIALGISRSGTAAGPYYLDDIGLITK